MAPAPIQPDSTHIETSIERICGSPGFRRSARLQRFLRFLASVQAATGHGPKEYEVAREVYDKPADFDPQTDPIVRVEASRLRLRLAEYYQSAGRSDCVVLELPKGSYTLRCRPSDTAGVSISEVTGARRHYLRGRHLWNKRTTESLQEAIVCFRKAIDEDFFYAAAWSGLADCYTIMGSFEIMHPDAVFPRAIAAAQQALELDPNLAAAHCSLATAAGMYQWDAEQAFNGFARAIALDPQYASAWHFYGVILFGRGLYDRALEALERAHSLDPLSAIIRVQIASLHFLTRNFTQAVRICEEVITLDPDFWPARWFAGTSLQQQARPAEALRHLEMAVQMSHRSPMSLGALGHFAGVEGRREIASSIANELEQRRLQQHSPAIALALVYLGMQEHELALNWLRTACKDRSPYLAMFAVGDPRLDPIRAEPEFVRIASSLQVPK